MAGLRKLIAGNWKMNGLKADLGEIGKLKAGLGGVAAEVALCVPATLIAGAVEAAKGSPIVVGGQDCASAPAGAFTGDISAEMIADAGGKAVIVGHSERRTGGETDARVRLKTEAAWRAGLLAILCIGETGEERKNGDTFRVLDRQLDGSVPDASTSENLVIAYEPVWAIGTGLTPTPDDIAAAHAHIRARLESRFPKGGTIRLLYGGSVKPSNAAEILALPGVDGSLVGGASLKAADFLAIIAASG